MFLLISELTFGQSVMAPPDFSRNEKLSIDAFQIFNTNKYLDFKKRDSLIAIINDTIYKKTELNNYFGYKKNWKEIENETFETYKQKDERYKYAFEDNTMIETYNKFGSYGVSREMKTIYNAKGFITYQEEKVFVEDNYNETRLIINKFDDKNRVIRITKKTERPKVEENKEETIEATYTDNSVTVKSENGLIVCKFITDENSVGFISKLSPRETAKYFFYSLKNKDFDIAKEYCTDKMSLKISSYSIFENQINDVKWLSGTDKYSDQGVKVEDIWEMKFSEKTQKYNVEFAVIKQQNGWKIADFKMEEMK